MRWGGFDVEPEPPRAVVEHVPIGDGRTVAVVLVKRGAHDDELVISTGTIEGDRVAVKGEDGVVIPVRLVSRLVLAILRVSEA